MSIICEGCGSELKPTDKFCLKCGTPAPKKKVETIYCMQCGNMLKAGARFCNVCGKEVAAEKPKAEPAAPAGPTTMDELVVPEITDDMFGGGGRNVMTEKYDGFEAAEMPATETAQQPQKPAPVPEFAMDTAVSSDTKKPAPAPTPAPVRSAPSHTSEPGYQQQAFQQAPQQNYYANPAAPIPTVRADGQEKKPSKIVPVILAVLILAVLVLDAIFLLPKIMEKDDGETENETKIFCETDDLYYIV